MRSMCHLAWLQSYSFLDKREGHEGDQTNARTASAAGQDTSYDRTYPTIVVGNLPRASHPVTAARRRRAPRASQEPSAGTGSARPGPAGQQAQAALRSTKKQRRGSRPAAGSPPGEFRLGYPTRANRPQLGPAPSIRSIVQIPMRSQTTFMRRNSNLNILYPGISAGRAS